MRRRLLAMAFLLGSALVPVSAASESTIVARVNGVELTQSDLDFAATELGPMLARHSQDDRKRALISYVIENQLMADAAVEENLNQEDEFSDRQKYHDRRALADAYFAKHIKGAVPEEAAKEFYDEQYKPQDQVHVRHILLDSEKEAERVAERLQAGEDFSKLAKDQSKDKTQGGDLGFISRGETVKPFEDAAFSLKEREISKPVQTKFGWHIIQIQGTRTQPPPPFEQVKQQIMGQLLQSKARALITQLRSDRVIEYVDPEAKNLMKADGSARALEGDSTE